MQSGGSLHCHCFLTIHICVMQTLAVLVSSDCNQTHLQSSSICVVLHIHVSLLTSKLPSKSVSCFKISDINSVTAYRQKTIDPKTFCPCYYSTKRIVGGKGRGFWCGSCLYIRMGENLHEVKSMKDWRCPCCRDICNCSGANCLRARRNLAVTNQLIHEATKQGFKSVSSPTLLVTTHTQF